MKWPCFFLAWGIASWVANYARGGEAPSASHIGSITGLKGQVELRERPDQPAWMLDADRDLYRPLYEGVQVRCKAGGEVRLFLQNSGRTNLTATVWITLPSGLPLHNPAGASLSADQVSRPSAATPSRKATPVRRALLVGINEYRPAAAGPPLTPARNGQGRRDWTDLDGCVNDAQAIRGVLIARFGFAPDNILTLTDSQATRTGILDAFRRHLIESSLPGDVAFFYFAGHGSQITNTKSPEPDKRDETIVPADSSRGARDIRDKELRRMMNAVLDRGAILTAVFDSCHSGSVSRGPFEGRPKSRRLPPDPQEVADDSNPGPDPKSRGAAILSAALDTQEAGEQKDADKQPHGAFTLALLNTLKTDSAHETLEQVFLSTKATLQTEGSLQEPVLDALPDRLKRTLFGEAAGHLNGKTLVAVLRVRPDGMVEFQGGRALALAERCELLKLTGVSGQTAVRVVITKVTGMASSVGKVTSGSPADLKPGDLFELDRWFPPPEAALRLHIPSARSVEPAELQTFLRAVTSADRLKWVTDPSEEPPTHIIAWDGLKWTFVEVAHGTSQALGSQLDASALLALLSPKTNGLFRVFLHLPPPQTLVDEIKDALGVSSGLAEFASPRADAHYWLTGRASKDGQVAYTWLSANAGAGVLPLTSLPSRTDWHNSVPNPTAQPEVAHVLAGELRKLARIKGWLNLPKPPGPDRFPYYLLLTNEVTRTVQAGGTVSENDRLRVLLRAGPDRLKEGVSNRFVYVFVLDSDGSGTLVFPQGGEADVSRLPPTVASNVFPAEIALPMPTPIRVTPPPGVDTYIMIATDKAIPNAGARPGPFNFSGVKLPRSTLTRGDADPLAMLLDDVGLRARSSDSSGNAVPTDWTIRRLTVRSVSGKK